MIKHIPNAAEKICSKCGANKQINCFPVEKRVADGRASVCIDCENKRRDFSCKAYPEKRKLVCKNYRINNAKKVKISKKKWQINNPESGRKATKKHAMLNPEKLKITKLKVYKKRRQNIKKRLSDNISGNIRHSLKTGKNGRSWKSLVNFTIDQLRMHIEKLFKNGMTWENYGTAWEIDHKIPLAAFNFERPEDIDFRICWSLKNLQPLGVSENRSKSDKVDKPFQPSLLISAMGQAPGKAAQQ